MYPGMGAIKSLETGASSVVTNKSIWLYKFKETRMIDGTQMAVFFNRKDNQHWLQPDVVYQEALKKRAEKRAEKERLSKHTTKPSKGAADYSAELLLGAMLPNEKDKLLLRLCQKIESMNKKHKE